ncbi:MAG: NAD(P)-binding domain-containing protein [Myxococcota bacterium]
MKVGVLGGGPWGLALARAAARAKAEVLLISRRFEQAPSPGIRLGSLHDLRDTSLVIVAVPTTHVRKVAREVGEHLGGGHLLVHGIRGLSGDKPATVSSIFREETAVRRLGALGGPVQAKELDHGQPSAIVVGSAFADVRTAFAAAFAGPWLQIYPTEDLVGLEWASALVGCLSIGVGYVQARPDVSPGLLAALISRAVDEGAAIARAAGGEAQTLYGLAGYGDLIASMALTDRPEVVLGRTLAEGKTLPEAQAAAELRIEAVELVPRLARIALQQGFKDGVFSSLHEILKGDKSPTDLVRRIFRTSTS